MTTRKCMGCGVDKDPDQFEVSPHAKDDGLVSIPIDPLLKVDCYSSSGWRVVSVCHECFHRLDVDMWISEECWASISPITPFDQLPKLSSAVKDDG